MNEGEPTGVDLQTPPLTHQGRRMGEASTLKTNHRTFRLQLSHEQAKLLVFVSCHIEDT